MLLYIVRHGEPNYKSDSLLPDGWVQAELVAERLMVSRIDRIYSSPMQRARQTASPLAYKTGLPINIESWAYELDTTCHTTIPDGKEKTIYYLPSAYLTRPEYRGYTTEEALDKIDALNERKFKERYMAIAKGADDFTERLGYQKLQNGLYRQVNKNDKHIALFCHAAMMRALLSHILNIPIQYFASTLGSYFTGVTILDFELEDNEIIMPRLLSYGDAGHMYALGKPIQNQHSKEYY